MVWYRTTIINIMIVGVNICCKNSIKLEQVEEKTRAKRNTHITQAFACADSVEPSRQWRDTFQRFGSNMSSCAISSQSQT